MDKNNLKPVSRRLLAFALSILLIISILPVNLLTVWAERIVSVTVAKEGNGKVYYEENGSSVELKFADGQDQDDFEVDLDTAGDTVTTLRFQATGENGIVSKVKLFKTNGTCETIHGGGKELSVKLTRNYFTDSYLDNGKFHVEVDFGTTQPKTAYTVKAAASNEHASVYVVHKDEETSEETFEEINTTGRQYTELPLTIQVSPESAAYEIETVQVVGGRSFTLSNSRFTLTEGDFNTNYDAEIAVTVKSAVTEEVYKLNPVSLSNCTATIKRGGNSTALVSGTEITAAELAAGVTLTFTASPATYTVSSVKINQQNKVQASDQGKSTFSWNLTAADFGEEKTIEVEAVFAAPDSEETPQLVIGNPTNYQVWVKNSGGSYPAEPQTGTVDLVYPATIKVRSTSEEKWVSNLYVSLENGDIYADLDFEPGREAELVLGGGTIFANSKTQTLHVELAQAPSVTLSLASDSSKKAQVYAAVKHSGEENYPETKTQITSSKPLTVLSGDSAMFTVTADKSYVVMAVYVNGGKLDNVTYDGSVAAFELTGITAAQEIRIETASAVTLSARKGNNMTVKLSWNNREVTADTANMSLVVKKGEDVAVTVTAASGYVVTGIKVRDSQGRESLLDLGTQIYHDSVNISLNADRSYQIFGIVDSLFNLETNPFTNGKVKFVYPDNTEEELDADSSLQLSADQLVGAKLKFIPNSGYAIHSLEVGENPDSDAYKKTTYTYPLPDTLDGLQELLGGSKTLTVRVDFEKLFTVTANVQSGTGTVAIIVGGTEQGTSYQAFENEEIILRAVPGNGYIVGSITDENNNALEFNPKEDGSVDASITVASDVSLKVKFETQVGLNGVKFYRNNEEIHYFEPLYSTISMQVYVFAPDHGHDPANPLIMKTTKGHQIYFDNKDGYYYNTGDDKKEIRASKSIHHLYYQNSVGWWKTIYISQDNNNLNLYIIIDEDLPTIASLADYDNQAYNIIPTINVAVEDPSDPKADVSAAAAYSYSGLGKAYYYFGEYVEGTTELHEIKTYTGSKKSDTLNFQLEGLEKGENKVTLVVEDRAENKQTASFKVWYNPVEPLISLQFSDSDYVVTNEKGTFFPQGRTATVTVWDIEETFAGLKDGDNSLSCIVFKDSEDNEITDCLTFAEGGEWVKAVDDEGKPILDEEDRAKYTATVSFKEGVYALSGVTYTNTASGTASQDLTENFTVDWTRPTGTAKIQEKGSWTKLLETLTFGLWNDGSATVTVEAADAVSGVARVDYYVYYYESEDDVSFKSESELMTLYALDQQEGQEKNWHEYSEEGIQVEADKRFVVYVRVEDYATNTLYLSTNGIITDGYGPTVELMPPAGFASEVSAVNLYGREEDEAGNPVETVDIPIKVTEPAVRSGIHTVEYQITKEPLENPVTAEGWKPFFTAPLPTGEGHPTYSELMKEFSEETNAGEATIPVSKADFNACEVHVYVRATDNAGIAVVNDAVIDIDYSNPTIQIEFIPRAEDAPETDYPLIAKITYTERSSHFDGDSAKAKLTVQCKDQTHDWANVAYDIIETDGKEWIDTVDPTDPDKDTHVLQLGFRADFEYQITANYEDRAGNAAETATDGYILDQTPPTCEITIDDVNNWDYLLATLTFGLWSNKAQLTVRAENVQDNISDPEKVTRKYYVAEFTDESGATDRLLTWEELDNLPGTDWNEYEGPFTVDADKRFVVYLRMEDEHHNVGYIWTDGVILEQQGPTVEIMLPDTAYTSEAEGGKTKLYGREEDEAGTPVETVDIPVKVTDPEVRSGIHTVEYQITKEPLADPATAEGWTNLFTATPPTEEGHPTYSDLMKEFSEETNPGEATIPVTKADFNACEVHVYVRATDNAGNPTVAEKVIDIDYTNPTINIEFIPRAEDAPETDYPLIAVITYTERSSHFDGDSAKAGLTVQGKDQEHDWADVEYDIIETDGNEWLHTENSADPDQDTHVLKLGFRADFEYQITADYTDRAGNGAETAKAGCILDQTPPTCEITIDDINTWDTLLTVLTFGLWSDEQTLTVHAENVKDNISSPEHVDVKYYVAKFTDESGAPDRFMTLEELEKLGTQEERPEEKWNEYEGPFTVEANIGFVVYLRMEDEAHQVGYFWSDGVILEHLGMEVEFTLPETGYLSADGKTPIYGNGADNVEVKVKVTDPEVRSGIHTVEYQITTEPLENPETAEGWDNMFTAKLPTEEGHPTYSDLVKEFSEETDQDHATITVSRTKYNACEVYVYVRATDNAGNVTADYTVLDIDATDPTIDVAYQTTKNDNAFVQPDNFTSVTAVVTITERNHHFNYNTANAGIVISGVDGTGKNLNLQKDTDYVISSWSYQAGNTPDEDKHVATIEFLTDANYTLKIDFTDCAGNKAGSYSKEFSKDATPPVGTLEIKKLDTPTWNQIVEKLTFALFSQESVDVAHTAFDATSKLYAVDYFQTDRDTLYSATELSKLDNSAWKKPTQGNMDSGSLTVSPNVRAVVYLRVADRAGNICYVSTNGFILDNKEPSVDQVAPRVTVSQPVNGFYNTDVPIRVQVTDPVVNGSYSGLKEIRYEIRNMGTVTQSGTLYTYSGTAEKQNQLLQKYEKDAAITVDRAKNNSNDVEIIVYAVDNAGNKSQGSEKIKIDVTAPTVRVEYANNNAHNGFYFNETRTATITITERNFDAKDVNIQVNTVGGAQPTLSTWRTEGGGGNGDGTKHIATLTFSADGDYTFDISFKDQAGNPNTDVTWVGTAPQKFTIDKTAPVITVKPDEAALNGSFYKNDRVDTITITEHNFDPNTVVIDVETNGAQPVLSAWSNNGDTHTATLTYSADGNYTVKLISNTDLAGNKTDYTDLASKPFTVDHTVPKLTVSLDKTEARTTGYFNEVRTATITVTETNFDPNGVKIDVTSNNGSQPSLSAWKTEGSVHTATMVFNMDGNYKIQVECTDLAGNVLKDSDATYLGNAPQEFVVDQTAPTLKFDGVANESANNTKDNIGFTLVAADTNFDEFTPTLTRYFCKDGKFVQEPIDLHDRITDNEDGNGKTLTIKDLPEDGVYILECTVIDKAGNAFIDFTRNGELIQANGTENVRIILFSVNRNGSTFYADDYTIAVLMQYYVQSVDQDLVIYEYNSDRLTGHAVALNSTELSDNADYTMTEDLKETGNTYTYTISKDLFEAEGSYNLVISSEDEANNTAYSDLKGVKEKGGDGEFNARFVVDRSAPVVTVSGLEDNGRYQTDAQRVTLIPADDGGLLGSLRIELVDQNGNVVETLTDLEGEALQTELRNNDGKIEFTLAERAEQYNVDITCKDTAGNETKLEYREVTVSTNALRIFWANKPLRWGSIGGAGGAGALLFFLLLAKKRKKKEEEVVPEKKA